MYKTMEKEIKKPTMKWSIVMIDSYTNEISLICKFHFLGDCFITLDTCNKNTDSLPNISYQIRKANGSKL